MNDQKKTKAQLIAELTALRRRVAELEQAETGRKQVEEKLQEHLQFLQTLLNTIPSPIFYKDRAGRYTGCNQAFERFTGRSRAEIIGKMAHNMGPPEIADEYHQRDEKLFRNPGTQSYDWKVVSKNGEIRDVIFNKATLVDATGQATGLVGVISDITARKQAEQKLQQSEEKYRALFENMAQGVFYQRADGELVDVNPAALKMFGLSRDQFLGKTSYDLQWKVLQADGVDLTPERHPSMEALQTGKVVRDILVGVYNPQKESYVWLNINAMPQFRPAENEPYQAFVTLHDMTELKEAEEALRKERDFAETLIETAQVIVLVLDTQGRIMRFNPYLAEISGYTLAEVQGKDWFDIFLPGRDHDRIRNLFRQSVSNIQVRGNVNSIMTKDGREREIEWYDKTLKDAGGHIVGVLAVGQDITERRRAEEQIKASLREKELLLQEIHHRVKNNLQVISSLLDMQADTIEDPRILQVFHDSQQRVRSMSLVHEKLYQSADLARVDFADYIQEMVDYLFMVYSDWAWYVTPRLEVAESFLMIDTAIPCGLIINELVSNALKHAFPPPPPSSPPAREIEEGSPEIRISFEKRGGDCLLIVGDNGIGLPPDVDIDDSPSLGLQLVRILTNQLQGTIEIDRNDGTTFNISFLERKST